MDSNVSTNDVFGCGLGKQVPRPDQLLRVEPLGSIETEQKHILIGICSCHRNVARREAVRETWIRSLPSGVAALFFMGDGARCAENGTVCLPVLDDYDSLPAKVHYFYRYALAHYEFAYLFKCDDDTYVHGGRLRKLPRPDVGFLGSVQLKYGRYASGGAGYLMSRVMVERLVVESAVQKGPEDVIFSVRAKATGMRMESTDLLHGFGKQVPEIGNEIVTGHWCSPSEMRRIHAELVNELPGPALIKLHARHAAWSGAVHLYSGGSFRGGASNPHGTWAMASGGEQLVLQWDHWPLDLLHLRSWGFECANLRLEFDDDGFERWQRLLRDGVLPTEGRNRATNGR